MRGSGRERVGERERCVRGLVLGLRLWSNVTHTKLIYKTDDKLVNKEWLWLVGLGVLCSGTAQVGHLVSPM